MSAARLRLLCAFDGSAPSKAAIRTAAALFAPADATILTVRENPPFTDAALQTRLALPSEDVTGSLREYDRQLSREAQATADEGVALAESRGLAATASVLRSDRPWRAVAAMAAGHDVIVCGTRGRGALRRVLLGSTAWSLLSRASRPLLIASGETPAPEGPLLVGYDGTGAAEAALRFAAGRAGGRELVVVSVWRSPVRHSLEGRTLAGVPLDDVGAFVEDYDDRFRGVGERDARAGARIARSLGTAARWRAIESRSPWRALLDAAEAEHAAAVVCGAGHTGLVPSGLTGSVATSVVHHATLPVLVVPEVAVPGDGPPPEGTAAASGPPRSRT